MRFKEKKSGDQKKLKAKMQPKASRMGTRDMLPPYTLIVSEGTKTEPYYLQGFADKINRQYRDISGANHIVIFGTGRNTKDLLRFTEKKIEDGTWSRFYRIWLVYDKDDFPLDHFDNTQFSAENRKNQKFRVAWSNESVELWFLLHFQDYHSNNGRKQYIEKLNQYFDYSKTREDIFDVISEKGSPDKAKRRARRMYQEFLDEGITSPSAMVPATRMYELIEELEGYLH